MAEFEAKLAKVRDHREKLQAQLEYEEGKGNMYMDIVLSVCVVQGWVPRPPDRFSSSTDPNSHTRR